MQNLEEMYDFELSKALKKKGFEHLDSVNGGTDNEPNSWTHHTWHNKKTGEHISLVKHWAGDNAGKSYWEHKNKEHKVIKKGSDKFSHDKLAAHINTLEDKKKKMVGLKEYLLSGPEHEGTAKDVEAANIKTRRKEVHNADGTVTHEPSGVKNEEVVNEGFAKKAYKIWYGKSVKDVVKDTHKQDPSLTKSMADEPTHLSPKGSPQDIQRRISKKIVKRSFKEHALDESVKVGDRIRTLRGGQIPGYVTKIEGDYVHFNHSTDKNQTVWSGAKGLPKSYRTHKSNVVKEEREVGPEEGTAKLQQQKSLARARGLNPCAYCQGDGNSRDKNSLSCQYCNGSGVAEAYIEDMMPASKEKYTKCTTCGGAGYKAGKDSMGKHINKPCSTCKGAGLRQRISLKKEEVVTEAKDHKDIHEMHQTLIKHGFKWSSDHPVDKHISYWRRKNGHVLKLNHKTGEFHHSTPTSGLGSGTGHAALQGMMNAHRYKSSLSEDYRYLTVDEARKGKFRRVGKEDNAIIPVEDSTMRDGVNIGEANDEDYQKKIMADREKRQKKKNTGYDIPTMKEETTKECSSCKGEGHIYSDNKLKVCHNCNATGKVIDKQKKLSFEEYLFQETNENLQSDARGISFNKNMNGVQQPDNSRKKVAKHPQIKLQSSVVGNEITQGAQSGIGTLRVESRLSDAEEDKHKAEDAHRIANNTHKLMSYSYGQNHDFTKEAARNVSQTRSALSNAILNHKKNLELERFKKRLKG